MAIIASFSPAWGSLVALGDAFDNPIELTRNAAGQLFINGGSVTIFGGTPTVTNTRYVQLIGQAGNDVLSVNESSGALPPVTLIGGDGDDTLTGGSGSDTLRGDNGNDTLFGRLGADILRGGAGNDTLNGGDGNDRLFGEDGNDTFVWNPGDDNDVIEGGAGSDTLLFNGANVGENIGISANGGRVLFTRDVANVTIDLNDTEIIRYNALGGADTIVVNNLAGTDATQIDINLGASGGGGDGAADTVITNGTGNADVIAVTGAGSSVSVVGLPAQVAISNAEDANDTLAIYGLGGADQISATMLAVGIIKLTIDGGAGEDTILGSQGADVLLGGDGNDFIVGDNGSDVAFLGADDDIFQWDPGDGSDIVEGQAGSDTLLFNGSNISENIGISANGGRVLFTRDIANVTMDLNDIETIKYNALGGADHVVVGDLTGTDVTTVRVDLGASGGPDGQTDTIAVNATAVADSISVTTDASGINILGLQAAVRIANADATDELVLNGLGGDDTMDASGLGGSILLTLNGGLGTDLLLGGQAADLIIGGDGNDVALMGGGDDTFVWSPGDDNDVVEGQAGSDTLLFNGANVGENIGISANGGRVLFTRDVANVTIDLNDTEIIRYNALGGADTIVVNNLAGTDATQIDINLGASGGGGDGAADTVIVNGTASDDVIVVLQDAEGVLVLGLAAAVRIRNFEAGTDQLIINSLGGSDVIDASGVTSFGLTLTSAEGDDVLIGGSGNDILSDGSGDDVIIGGPGIDIWIPGGGSDIFIQ